MAEPKSYAFLLMRIGGERESNLCATNYGLDKLFEEEINGVGSDKRQCPEKNFYSECELFEFSTEYDREIGLQLAGYVEYCAGFENNNYVGLHYKKLNDSEFQVYKTNH